MVKPLTLTIWSSWAYHPGGAHQVSEAPTRWFTGRGTRSLLSDFGSLGERDHVRPRVAKLVPRALELMSMQTHPGFPSRRKIARAV